MVNAPNYPGYDQQWSDSFDGSAGTLPNEDRWNIIDGYLNVNNEFETYKKSSRNVQCSGGKTLQLVPWKDGTSPHGWSSGRVESKYTFTPVAGGKTMAEALIRFGGNDIANKQGIWPAFWILGDALRHPGGSWPACGELDILETVNGQLTGYGTAHGDVYPGGIFNEPNGIQGHISIPDQGWHVWRMVWDRSVSSWQDETITWFMDGQQFNQISGSRIDNEGVWAVLCHSPLFFILNNAVGGGWVGGPLSFSPAPFSPFNFNFNANVIASVAR
jgi:beta-glucanase (GH16 family)